MQEDALWHNFDVAKDRWGDDGVDKCNQVHRVAVGYR